jgi:hypothetical protein
MSKSKSIDNVDFVEIITELKIIVIICGIFCLFATIPNQILELYRFSAQSLASSYRNGSIEGFRDAVIVIIFITTIALIFVAISIFLLKAGPSGAKTQLRETKLVLSLLASVPALAVGVGWLRATVDVASEDLKSKLLYGAEISFCKGFQ